MANRKESLFGIINLLIMMSLFVACSGDQSNNALKAKVILKGDALVTPPCPVTIAGVQIGTVSEKTLDQEGHPVLELDIDSKYLNQLKKSTVFYIKSDGKQPRLEGEVLDNAVHIENENLVFLGFSSYTRYLGWRAGVLAQKGIKHTMDFINEALKNRNQASN